MGGGGRGRISGKHSQRQREGILLGWISSNKKKVIKEAEKESSPISPILLSKEVAMRKQRKKHFILKHGLWATDV